MLFFTVAVISSAAYGSIDPGLSLTTTLSAGTVLSLFHGEILTLPVPRANVMLFSVVGATISIVMGRFKKTNAALLQAKRNLEFVNEKLSERTDELAQANAARENCPADFSAPARVTSIPGESDLMRSACSKASIEFRAPRPPMASRNCRWF